MSDSARQPGKQPNMTRRTIAIAGVVAVLLGAGVATAVANLSDNGADQVDALLAEMFTGECITSLDADASVSASLAEAGLTQWTVTSRGDGEDCVVAGYVPESESIVLVPVDHPEVTAALHAAADELMASCMDEGAAREFVSSVLAGVGVTEFKIRTDGPIVIADGEEEATNEHLEAGCYVYSGPGRDGDGDPVYYLAGGAPPEPTPSG